MNKHRLVVVGGGFASVKLAKELGSDDRFEVTIVAPHASFEYHGAMYRSANGRSPLEVVVPFREIFAGSNVLHVNDFMLELRSQTNEIKLLSGRTLQYDTLALGLGYEVEYYGISGMREHAESMYTVSDAIKLRKKLLDTFIQKDKKHVDVVVAGAGPTGVEIASSIDYFASLVKERYNKCPESISITIIDSADRILPSLKPKMSSLAGAALKKSGISILTNTKIVKCQKKTIVLNDHEHIPYDVVIWTAGSRGNPFFEKYPDVFFLEKKGRVAVNEYLQPYSPHIYVMGDSASTPYSGMAQTAIADGVFVAQDLRLRLEGKERTAYEPKEPVYAVPVGVDKAIVDNQGTIVTGKAGWLARRNADLWVLQNFLPHKEAVEHWRHGEKLAQF